MLNSAQVEHADEPKREEVPCAPPLNLWERKAKAPTMEFAKVCFRGFFRTLEFSDF